MKARTVQSSFLSGVLDPRAAGRVDTESYNSALYTGENVIVHHLGGVRRRPGLKFLQQLPNVLALITPTTITCPEGDSSTVPANANDQDETTFVEGVSIGTTDPFVVVHYDLGSAKSVSHADVKQISLSAGTSDEFRIQYSTDNSTFVDFGDPLTLVDTNPRDYRRNILAITGPQPVTARYWRVAKVGGTDLSTASVSLAEFSLWSDTGTISNVRLFSFELTTETRYLVAVTDRSATVLLNGAVPDNGSFPLPYVSADIPDLDGVVGADSLFLVHEDYAPRYIIDEFSGEDFQTGEIQFVAVPQYDYNDADSPTPTSEVQVLTFNADWVQGDTFQIELDGARTGLVVYAGDTSAAEQTTTAANIARAVQQLYTVPGLTGVSCSRTGALTYTVTFAEASAKTYTGLMNVTPGTIKTSTAAATTTRTTPGVPRSEDVWSATRGYPRTVTFYEGRLYFGGTKSRLQSLFGSAVNDITDFEILQALDADPIFVTLNGQQLNAINGVFSGRSLQIFTSGGEFRYNQRNGDPITPSLAPSAQTQYGGKRIRPVAIDGSTVFVQRLGKSIRDFSYSYEEDAYTSLGLSSLAPHLISGASDLAAWQGSSTDEINLVYVINGDGTVAVLNLRREANVRAWTKWTTDGLFKAGATTVEEVYFAVKRTIDSTDVLFLEQALDTFYVDAGVNTTGGAFAGANHLANEECRVRLQSSHLVLSDETPDANGTVTPSESAYAAAAIQVGLNFNPTVTPMPLNTMTPIGANFLDKRRVKKVRVKVYQTLGLRVNDRVLPDRFFDIDDLDLDPTPFSGNITLEETTDWDETQDKFVVFTQVDPLPMNILSIAVDMETAV